MASASPLVDMFNPILYSTLLIQANRLLEATTIEERKVRWDSELYQCSAMRYPLFPFMAPDREFEVRCAKEAHVITTLQTCAVLINTMTEGPLQHYMLTPKWREKYVVYRNGEVEFMIDMHWLYNYAARLELLQMAAAPPLLPLAQS